MLAHFKKGKFFRGVITSKGALYSPHTVNSLADTTVLPTDNPIHLWRLIQVYGWENIFVSPAVADTCVDRLSFFVLISCSTNNTVTKVLLASSLLCPFLGFYRLRCCSYFNTTQWSQNLDFFPLYICFLKKSFPKWQLFCVTQTKAVIASVNKHSYFMLNKLWINTLKSFKQRNGRHVFVQCDVINVLDQLNPWEIQLLTLTNLYEFL